MSLSGEHSSLYCAGRRSFGFAEATARPSSLYAIGFVRNEYPVIGSIQHTLSRSCGWLRGHPLNSASRRGGGSSFTTSEITSPPRLPPALLVALPRSLGAHPYSCRRHPLFPTAHSESRCCVHPSFFDVRGRAHIWPAMGGLWVCSWSRWSEAHGAGLRGVLRGGRMCASRGASIVVERVRSRDVLMKTDQLMTRPVS